jgi:hypothetical protein
MTEFGLGAVPYGMVVLFNWKRRLGIRTGISSVLLCIREFRAHTVQPWSLQFCPAHSSENAAMIRGPHGRS